MKRRCEGCGERFVAHPAVRQQRYCSGEACQRARKRRWQARKLATDADYRQNQAAAQKAWRDRNLGYWRDYRRRNPGAAERNREGQRERNRKRRRGQLQENAEKGEKGEKARLGTPVAARGMVLIPAGSGGAGVIAKMDELFMEVAVIQQVGLGLLADPEGLQRWTSYFRNVLWFHDLRFRGPDPGVIAKRGRAGFSWSRG
jgi:hypothetical protein